MVGKGAAQAHADSLIRQLVDKAGIPVLSTSMGRGVVSDTHPLSVGAARSLALSQSDVVVIFGARYAAVPPYCHMVHTFDKGCSEELSQVGKRQLTI